ncbi:MAG TPA: peptidylprolyl isomerase [Pyrinomonadaceae bacterium]|nr:peptidylprolyl isomerase [Pyrinomonadaceae bacterium]
MNIAHVFFLLLIASVISGCNNKASSSNKTAAAAPVVKQGVKPVADNEIAVIEMENPAAFGTIKMELYSNIAPKMVAQFKQLAREGFYDGTTFHRVNQSVIQGGDPNSKDANPRNDGTGGSDKPDVAAEFSDIPYEAGIVGAARSQDFDSANSQFFITLKREAAFDNKYTIFGKVVEGMNNVRTISGVQPKEGERPIEPVKIKSVTIQPKN